MIHSFDLTWQCQRGWFCPTCLQVCIACWWKNPADTTTLFCGGMQLINTCSLVDSFSGVDVLCEHRTDMEICGCFRNDNFILLVCRLQQMLHALRMFRPWGLHHRVNPRRFKKAAVLRYVRITSCAVSCSMEHVYILAFHIPMGSDIHPS